MKYVWLNIITGEFSDSFTIEDHVPETISDLIQTSNEVMIKTKSASLDWKLIQYDCLNDQDFELSRFMKLR